MAREVSPEEVQAIVEELFPRLWEAWRCRPITKDRLGRCCAVCLWSFLARAVRLALEHGIEDPLHAIDWEAVVDPDITRGENLRRLEQMFSALVRKRTSLDEVEAEVLTYLDMEEAYIQRVLREEEERLTPEQREELLRRLAEIREERAKLLAKARERAEHEKPRRVERVRRRRPEKAPAVEKRITEFIESLPSAPPAPSPPPRPPAPPPAPPAIPIEEARHRIETYIRSRVPRVYRFDWTDLRARISYHREVEDALRREVEALGGRVERVVAARPPLKIMYADFSGARVPPAVIPAELEREILWSKFSAALIAAGISPEEHVAEFEEVLEAVKDRPFAEKQRRVEELARRIVAAFRPPPPPPPPVPWEELLRRLERIERAVAWRPSTPEEIRMLAEAMYMVPPVVVRRVDEAGHEYFGPSDECMTVLRSILDRWAVMYFENCPLCRYRLPGGALSPVDFVEHLITKEAAVPPLFIDWLRRLARLIEEAERRGAPP